MVRVDGYQNNNAPKVFNNDERKPKRYGEDALNKGLIGKKVKVGLLNNQTIEGIFSNLGMYDLTVNCKVQQTFSGNLTREMEKSVIILKSAICTVEVVQ